MRRRKKISNPEKTSQYKLFAVVIFFTLASLGLIARLFYLQVIKHDYFTDKAKNIQLIKKNINATRGKIYDKHNNELVTSTKSLLIAVDPSVIYKMPKKKKEFLDYLSKIMQKPSKIYYKITQDTTLKYVILEKEVNIKHKEKLVELQFFGVIVQENFERIYPYDHLAAHILGFTNSDGIGISGLELQFDSILSGKPGYMVLKRDLRRNLHASADLPNIPPIDGYNLHLTIDINLQSIVEYELAKGVENYAANAGTVIVMNPQTGEILALASNPQYNPNIPAERKSSWVRNRAINDEYEPGSTFKMITAAAALEEKLVKPNDVFSGYGGAYKVGDYTIRDVHPLGNITFRQATEQSSNIVFAQVASKIPRKTFYKYIRDFGFGLLTDIELPGEAKGRIPKPENITPMLQKYIGFGYGISATPLQMLCAYCAAANGGNLVKPFILRKYTDNNGNTIFENKPKIIRKVISKETSDMIKDLFIGIVENGTGKAVKIANLKIAGKTGTSQQLVEGSYSKAHYNASFVGFFPVDNPQIAMIVVLDNPKTNYYGGATAAPIFRNIALRIINSSDILLK